MRPFLVCSVLVLLAVLTATPALASDRVILKDGSTRKAKVLEVLESSIRVRFHPKGGGTAELIFPAERLDAHYFYGLRDEAVGDDAKGRLKLALWALNAGLFSRAKIQVEQAAKLDPKLVKDIKEGKLPEIRDGIAERILKSAEDDMKDGRLELAERKLELLLARMPDTPAGTDAAAVYKDLEDRIRGRALREKEEALERVAEDKRKEADERDRLFKPVERDLRRGKELLTSGLTEDSEVKSLRQIKDAISRGKRATSKMERLSKDHADNKMLMTDIADYTARTTKGMVKAYLALADIYIWRGSTNEARKQIAEARKLDPDTPELASAEARADSRDEEDNLDISWTRARRQGMRFSNRGGGRGGRGGGGGRRR